MSTLSHFAVKHRPGRVSRKSRSRLEPLYFSSRLSFCLLESSLQFLILIAYLARESNPFLDDSSCDSKAAVAAKNELSAAIYAIRCLGGGIRASDGVRI